MDQQLSRELRMQSQQERLNRERERRQLAQQQEAAAAVQEQQARAAWPPACRSSRNGGGLPEKPTQEDVRILFCKAGHGGLLTDLPRARCHLLPPSLLRHSR